MSKIKKVFAREILDSRGNPTIETKIILDNGVEAKAAVPSGASKGKYEALELRDNDPNRYSGRGVLNACSNVMGRIANTIVGGTAEIQSMDETMLALDGTNNKSKLGANAILSVSLAIARVCAKDANLPLYEYLRKTYKIHSEKYKMPVPMFNVINGGKHSDSGLDIQEFLIIPMGGDSFKDRVLIGVDIFSALRDILKSKELTFAVGDEGGFAPKLKNTKKVFDLLARISEFTEHSLGKEVFFGIDAAASVFYDTHKKRYLFENKKRSSDDMLKFYRKLFKKYPIFTIEDPFAEDDWDVWPKLTAKIKVLNDDFLVIGDDLFGTNIKRLQRGIDNKVANAILIKPNQIGSVTETMKCISLAQDNNYKIVISHRSGETNDDFIADLAVAVGADFIKTGAPNRGERVAKYNRLMEIETELISSQQIL
ncbi:phosphopyruvate hydratase [Patescibacteria group bacterium]|nr:phosphopyruvate hydratase [Patescibacteria group bacterium]